MVAYPQRHNDTNIYILTHKRACRHILIQTHRYTDTQLDIRTHGYTQRHTHELWSLEKML